MSQLPDYNTAIIKCGKRKCKWMGKESDLASIPSKKFRGAEQNVCPSCGCDSYFIATEKEIAAWEKSK